MTQEELQIISNRDTHWDEVIKLCRKYGFVTQEYGNSVTLMTNSYQIDSWQEPTYRFRQEQLFGSFPQPGESSGQKQRAQFDLPQISLIIISKINTNCLSNNFIGLTLSGSKNK